MTFHKYFGSHRTATDTLGVGVRGEESLVNENTRLSAPTYRESNDLLAPEPVH